MSVGDLIEYRIALPGRKNGNIPVTLSCKGKVLRRQSLEDNSALEIAATLERYEFIRRK